MNYQSNPKNLEQYHSTAKKLDSMNFIKNLELNGYSHVREIDGKYYGLLEFMFTTGLVCDLNERGYYKRFCYENYDDALAALNEYSGLDGPNGPWIKEKGIDGERLNPKFGLDCFDCQDKNIKNIKKTPAKKLINKI